MIGISIIVKYMSEELEVPLKYVQYQSDNHALLSVAEQIYVPGKFHQGGTLVKFPERKDQLLFAPRKDFSYFIDDLLGPRGNMASTEPVHYLCTSLHNLGLLKFGIKFAS